MAGPAPAVADVRRAVRAGLAGLAGLEPGALVLVACSGGADSLALAAATASVAPRAGLRAGAVTVDHGLQEGSAARAGAVAGVLRRLGLDPVEVAAVRVGGRGGPEAAARDARYAALRSAAAAHGAAAVLLGHTRDDQAETVLLGLARGSGARSLAGMAAVGVLPGGPAGPGGPGGAQGPALLRPLLGLDRGTTRAACAALGLAPWDDPHNADPAYARARARHRALPALEAALGPGVAAALARTADLLRDDADALDAWASRAAAACTGPDGTLDAAGLAAEPAAVRRRVLRRAALAAGCPAGALTAGHLAALDGLLTRWRGQGPLDLPGGVGAARRCGRLSLARRAAGGGSGA
ncbi:tRNA lysidine(34) synthetase TilS [Vallicoccus soli]|uniref:tRNA(Ile)-lysidine synthase n=1 Tax=Vallicoccus soli TaxID=2339232 RepID=A0A3A3Z0U1_9ACTN|nr:tRNA lysidine(34) synthetase TilS [Vallicoccus soli]RJK96026.1 tRNA lysidine(34) synthetase TilS [Vallicoccus soli]